MTRSVLTLFLALCFPFAARADRVVVLATGGAQASLPLAQRAGPAVREQLARLGHTVLPDPRAERCADDACLARVRERTGADAVVLCTAFAGETPSVVITYWVSADEQYSAHAYATDVLHAVPTAVAAVLVRRQLGPGVYLRIEGEPEGAIVALDGTDVGVLPTVERVVSPGDHVLTVHLDGYAPHEQPLHFEHEDAGHALPSPVHVVLERAAPSGDHVVQRPTPRTHTVYPVLGPLLVGGAGLALVGVDVVGLALTGRAGPGRTARIDPGPFALYGGLGLAALTAAIIWFFVGTHEEPVTPSATVTQDAFVLGLSGRL